MEEREGFEGVYPDEEEDEDELGDGMHEEGEAAVDEEDDEVISGEEM